MTTLIINKENFQEKITVLYNDLINYWEIKVEIFPQNIEIIEADDSCLSFDVLNAFNNINTANFVKRW